MSSRSRIVPLTRVAPPAAPPKPARAPDPTPQLRRGSLVLFETLWKSPHDGWAIASRAYARALRTAGVDVRLLDWKEPEGAAVDASVLEELRGVQVGHPGALVVPGDLHVHSRPLKGFSGMQRLLRTLGDRGSAFYCLFERRHVEPELGALLDRLTGVWVSSSVNERVLREAGVRNVLHARFPYFDDDPLLKFDSPRDVRTFLYVGRAEPRKSPENVVRAFLRAFRPGEARLIVKLSPIPWDHDAPSPEAVVLDELAEPGVAGNGWTAQNWRASVEVVRGKLSAAEMAVLHARSDCYVSASRGEGLDLPCFAAKLAGRRVVTTASGGPEDFLGDGDVIVPATGRVEADPRYEWGPGAWYVDYSLDDLVAALQAVRGKPVGDGRDWPMHLHRADAVGQQLRGFLEACAERKRGRRRGA